MGYAPSKEEIRTEILRCGRDPVYFLNHYAKIAHPIRGLFPFKTLASMKRR